MLLRDNMEGLRLTLAQVTEVGGDTATPAFSTWELFCFHTETFLMGAAVQVKDASV